METFWGHGGTVSTTEMPPMWSFPAFMWEFLASGDKTCNDTLHYVNAVTQEQNPFVTAEAMEDMRDWLMLAGQCNQAEGKSLLAMTVEPCYSYDAGFQDWKELRINFTFGPCPSIVQANSQPQLQSLVWDAAAIAALVQTTTQSAVLVAR